MFYASCVLSSMVLVFNTTNIIVLSFIDASIQLPLAFVEFFEETRETIVLL